MTAAGGRDTRPRTDPRLPEHEIAIVGAGIAGLGMAVALLKAGISDFVIFERADDIGGVWRDNRYPGVAVDIPSHAYQFDYFPKPDWSRMYPRGDEVKRYLDDFAENFGLGDHLRFAHPVGAREWDEDAHVWRLEVAGRTVTARWLISAIGNFVLPRRPDIDGLAEYGGVILRPARWDHAHDLNGKRVAVIGTGASAVQIIPEIALTAAHVDVYQRTAIWVIPKLDPAIHPLVQRLFGRYPKVQTAVGNRLRAAMEWLLIGGVLKYQNPSTRRTVHALTWLLREVFYRRQVPDPLLRHRLIPRYGLGCKRPSLSSRYLRAFCLPQVDLVCEPIETVTATGIRTEDGIDRPVDAIVLATGYHMAYEPEVYRKEPVHGRAGLDLAECFATKRARSYEGVSIPSLPNYMFIYGPYGGTGGTYHDVVRVASMHIVRVISETRRRGATSAEIREEAADRWTADMRDRAARSLFSHNGCERANSYYFDRNGDNTFIRPTSSADAVVAQERFSLDDYTFSTVTASMSATRG